MESITKMMTEHKVKMKGGNLYQLFFKTGHLSVHNMQVNIISQEHCAVISKSVSGVAIRFKNEGRREFVIQCFSWIEDKEMGCVST